MNDPYVITRDDIKARFTGSPDQETTTTTTVPGSITIHFEKPDTWIWYDKDSDKNWETSILARPPGDMEYYRAGWYRKVVANTATVTFLLNDGTWENKMEDSGPANFVATADIWIKSDGSKYNSDPVTTTSTWTAPTKAEVLAYITGLSNGTIDGVISGQNAYHGSEITDNDYAKGYTNMIEALHTKTGRWIGLLSLDYGYSKLFSASELSSANKVLIDYWNAGGLISITMAPRNPWVNDESDIANNPGAWDQPGGIQDKTGVTTLDDLIDSTKTVNIAWMRKLDRMATALQELEDAGVVVLWRPMQEMNGDWMWWGMSSHPDDPTPYVNVYRHMYDYFTNTKGLSNLLWVYSPNDSYDQDNNSSWNRTVDWAYPGDEYVDIVSGTVYDDDFEVDPDDYSAYVALGKPLGLGEYSSKGKFAVDNRLYAKRLKEDYPKIAYWVSWHSYTPDSLWSIISNNYAEELMNDPYIITRDDIKVKFSK